MIREKWKPAAEFALVIKPLSFKDAPRMLPHAKWQYE
jgi:hypothetical protein